MTTLSRAGITVLLLALSISSAAAAEKINTLDKTGLFSYMETGIAIRGYDTVAYFTESRPVKGSTKFTTDWMGATWQFSSQEHQALFEAEPEKYAPQYGGYCAYGVAVDNLVKIEPNQWTITGGKLYLNYDKGVQLTWEKDISGFVETADRKFADLLAQ